MYAYVAAISLCIARDDGTMALQLLDRMREAGVPPNVYVYNHSLKACEMLDDWERALRLFEEMKAEGIPPSPHTFGALMRVCARNGKRGYAMKFRELLKKHPSS